MKPVKGQFPSAADRPDPKARIYLFYGADDSGSRAMGARLLKGLGAEKSVLSGATLKSDPGLLAAEAGAISMFGGRQLLWVEPAGEEVLAAVELLLDAPVGDHPVLLIAGALKKTSGLLKYLQAHPEARLHVSYVPEGHDAIRLVSELGRAEGLRVGPPIAAEIVGRCGNDQAVIAQELAKFALFLSASPESPQELTEEVLDLLGAESADTDVAGVGDLALGGDLAGLVVTLERLEASGASAIPVLRLLQRRLIALAGLRSRVESGQRPDQVLATVWQRDQKTFGRMLSRWDSATLAEAMSRVARLERTLLWAPAPQGAALGEELISIARASRR